MAEGTLVLVQEILRALDAEIDRVKKLREWGVMPDSRAEPSLNALCVASDIVTEVALRNGVDPAVVVRQ